MSEPAATSESDTESCCPSCGAPETAQSRIADLEAQVQLLKSKNTSTAEQLAEREHELQRLRSVSTSTAPTSPSTSEPPGRITSFLATTLRRAGPPSPPGDCSAAELARERKLRLEAEEKLQRVTAEVEDLSASLFQSANEMVAEERRIRSKLEQRVSVLEKREKEKEGRLGMLERAVETISRVRVLLNGSGGTTTPEEGSVKGK
ncbi:hypothetical protein EX30DRAFT_17711 [Ascodesmis nigricans]|uniref:GDP/GTP exchange factor Sec2 N-terminal domain-containing protein n=1 Tax=Ascodesmis nigricans TaxID=341454 RepID=A0A4S2N7I0_9PEZI|nr:hypothetical protein EX30DRAFT_17711 [Ascodesmis nigricans]